MVEHTFEPIYDQESKVLILGSFPSVKSREVSFYYGHQNNRFWKILSEVFDDTPIHTIAAKKELLLKYHIALWDVVKTCDIKGSSDVTIKNVTLNPIEEIIKQSNIQTVIFNGKMASKLFTKHKINQMPGITYVTLPSTSPANAAFTFSTLRACWKDTLLKVLQKND